MNDNEKIEDSLRPIDDVFDPDKRNDFLNIQISDLHEALSQINLVDDVPLNVRQLFETAKNVSLYTWFVYRFHPVSEMVAFAALEMALKERYYKEHPEKDREKERKTLKPLLKYARENKWIRNHKFSQGRGLAYSRVIDKKQKETIESGVLKNPGDSVPIEEPTEDEINLELEQMDVVERIVQAQADIRNVLMHGSSRLDNSSITRLRKTAEIINQVYS